MKPGTRVVSNSFDLGDWTADETASVGEECSSHCTAYFWIVPAKVEGTWQTPQGELKLEQKYQVVSGTLKNGNVIAPVTNGKLTGDQIAFTAAGTRYTGTVNGSDDRRQEQRRRQGSRLEGDEVIADAATTVRSLSPSKSDVSDFDHYMC